MKKFILIFCIIILLLFPSVSLAETDVIYGVAGDRQFPPYEYIDTDGKFKGFNVDVLKAIGLVTGMEFEFFPMKWEDAYYAIDRNQVDIIQGMKESESRKEKFLFSESLLVNSQSIFVSIKNTEIKGIKDLANRRVAVNIEDINYDEISRIDDIDIVQYESFSQALDALLNEGVEALIGNTLTINYLCKENNTIDEIKIVGDSLNESRYSIAVGKNNVRLITKINEGIHELQKNGMYESLYRKWFGTPIRNSKIENEGLFRLVVGISLILLVGILVVYKINDGLNAIIAQKTKEQKLINNELRRYDKMQFMDKIISSLAHEIRNPMTSIKLYVSQMDKKWEDKEFMLAASEDIGEEVERIEGLITEFVKFTSPRKALVENLKLSEELNNALAFVKLQIKNTKIMIDIKDDYFVRFDKSHLRQVILNILLNSEDAVKDIKHPLISINAYENKDNIILTIKDNGYGMELSELQYIFEPFYTTKEYGNGVGMFIVKQIIEENKGSIQVASDGKGQGMEIRVEMLKGTNYE